MSLTLEKNISNNYNISSYMRKEKIYRYDNQKYNHNKNIQAKSDRLHYILNKIKGENRDAAVNIVKLYDERKISQSDKLEDLLWELRFSNGKVVKNKVERLLGK